MEKLYENINNYFLINIFKYTYIYTHEQLNKNGKLHPTTTRQTR